MDITARRRAFEGVQNFRDFGGYAAGGKRIASGRFFRSANHALASDADLAKLADMEIATIVDLRRPEERTTQPSRRWPDFAAQVIENDDPDEGGESWQGFLAQWDLTADAFHGFQTRYYTRAPHLPRLIDLFSRYFDAVADSDGPIIVHCAAGKDRTGLIVALTHELAGVHRDDIVADYLLTNDPKRFAIFGPQWAKVIEQTHGRAPSQAVMEVAMGVTPAYLETALCVIAERHGDAETYISNVLGVDAKKRAAIEQKLFET